MTFLTKQTKRPVSLFEALFDREFLQDKTDGLIPDVKAAVDVYSDEDNVYVQAELPGVNKEEITVELHDGLLSITGEKTTKKEDKKAHYREQRYGRFERHVRVGDVDFDRAQAKSENGILKITLPKHPESKPKPLKIQ